MNTCATKFCINYLLAFRNVQSSRMLNSTKWRKYPYILALLQIKYSYAIRPRLDGSAGDQERNDAMYASPLTYEFLSSKFMSCFGIQTTSKPGTPIDCVRSANKYTKSHMIYHA